MISQMENGKRWFSQETLEAIAVALDCETGDLLRHHPDCPIYRMATRLAAMSRSQQATAERVIGALEK